jgi:hypothetical protein
MPISIQEGLRNLTPLTEAYARTATGSMSTADGGAFKDPDCMQYAIPGDEANVGQVCLTVPRFVIQSSPYGHLLKSPLIATLPCCR